MKMERLTGNWILWLALLLAAPLAHAKLTATVDRTAVSELDLVNYTLRLENVATTSSPNFAAVERDFDIVRQSGPNRSSRIVVTNGRQQSESYTEWELTLRPRREGRLTIPSLRVGSEVSSPITVNVTKASAADTRRMNQFAFFDTSVDKNDIYVQEQLIYTVKLFYVDSISGDFPPPPRMGDAVVETIENEKRYESIVNNRRYYVLEKQYAVFPQRSGTLKIPGERFNGLRSRGSFFSARESVNAISEGHTVTVRPRPASFSGEEWLPARDLAISEKWSENFPDFAVGEPVNRTITVRATGLASSLLPPFESWEIDGAKTYQDPADASDTPSERGIVATLETTVGIVPTREGELTIPEIRVPWWNTETDEQEVAIIPARTVRVAPGSAPTVTIPDSPTSQRSPGVIGSTSAGATANPIWLYVSIALALAWVATLYLWYTTRLQLRQLAPASAAPEPSVPVSATESEAFQRLQQACNAGDADRARRLLYAWGKARYPHIHSLQELASTTGNASLAQEIAAMETALFSATAGERWEGANLITLVKEIRQDRRTAQQRHDLVSDLNPS